MPPAEYGKRYGNDAMHYLGPEPNCKLDDLAAVARYFERYYRDAETGARTLEFRAQSKFKTIADKFEMIKSLQRDVFVPYPSANNSLISSARARLSRRGASEANFNVTR